LDGNLHWFAAQMGGHFLCDNWEIMKGILNLSKMEEGSECYNQHDIARMISDEKNAAPLM